MRVEKKVLFGVRYAIVDYASASDTIIEMASAHRSYGVTALAVHGLVTAVKHRDFGERLRKLDLVVPDGQPVRWALNGLCGASLKDRVYGPTLTLHVLQRAHQDRLRVFLFGSTRDTVDGFAAFIRRRFPGVSICGVQADRFRDATDGEDEEDVSAINASGAHIVLVGRGCPRQEQWVADHLGKIHAAMLAVGAAFDFHAGKLRQAPIWMQDHGWEWLFRLMTEPRRLWRRYLVTNSYFIGLVLRERIRRLRRVVRTDERE